MPTFIPAFDFWMVRMTQPERERFRGLVEINCPTGIGLTAADIQDFREALFTLRDGIDVDLLAEQGPEPNFTQRAFGLCQALFGTQRASELFAPPS